MLDSVFGLRAHEEISFASASGMTDLNATFAICRVDAGTNRIVVPLSTPQSYVAGGTWSRKAPHNTSGMIRRIYRTLSTAESTEYHYVGAIPATAASFEDKASDEVVAMGEILPSTGWEMPPPT